MKFMYHHIKEAGRRNRVSRSLAFALSGCGILLLLAACARMGQPDGGWYDETPPKVVSATPADGGVNVSGNKVSILFDEFIKIDNPTENVVVSPPQMQTPEIKGAGKKIEVKLLDSLKANTTYTIDFSDAITDNDEGNPLGNYTYSFSTGEEIDTLEVAGYVLNAEDLEPVKGILVGLYANHADSTFRTQPMVRVSRTDSKGHFIIRGVAAGTYRIYALKDVDGNYLFNQKSEQLAFTHDLVTPTSKSDIRKDTLWTDSLHIKNIGESHYTHFLPDDITLRAFTETLTDRYFIKSERTAPNHFSIYFSYGNDELPAIQGLNFNADNAFIVQTNEKRDSLTYWLRDTTLINKDTLSVTMRYLMTDSLGHLKAQTDTLQLLSKQTYARRMKDMQKKIDEWKKKQEKLRKKGERYDSIMPPEPLQLDIKLASQLDPDCNIPFMFSTPLASADTSKIHLYAKHDTLWYKAPYEFRIRRQADKAVKDTLAFHQLNYELVGEWRPDIEYSLEIDSAAFTDIYGLASQTYKQGFKVRSTDEYSTIILNISGMGNDSLVVQLLDQQDKVVKQTTTTNQQAEFFYVLPGKYYFRLFVDRNGNGRWDTGNYDTGQQAEEVYYYPGALECKAKWDMTESWAPKVKPLYEQKPKVITKQKADKAKMIQHRNAARAKEKGLTYVSEGM